MNLLESFWNLVIESAPWLLVGYLLAGIIKQVIPSSWVEKQLAETGVASVVKGAIIGAPLPLCSCGVIPTALAIRKAGASKGATASFLVATPETGVDSISYSYAILGPLFAIARPIGALMSAVTAGLLVRVMDTDDSLKVEPETVSSCCSSAQPEPVESTCCSSEESAAAESSCCSTEKSAPVESSCCASEGSKKVEPIEPGLGEKLISAVQYGYGRMISDTAKWLTIGLVAATFITTFVPQSFFLQWGDGLLAMLIMVVVGLPMYICATASTPVAASLLFAGISPGAALVFMLTGPATNIATMGVIREQLGTRSLAAYLIGVISMAILCGLALNQAFAVFDWSLQLQMMEHGESWPLWRQLAAVLLSVLVLRVFLQPRLASLLSKPESSGQSNESSSVAREAT
ncbi:MAG: SO_0444 family Cu/Zn efflux transporter [Gammaproteobacteria bacterium]|nr:SO_0444 family Cu/Zn efflux transporter [Gammaproteobacteria bacterium]